MPRSFILALILGLLTPLPALAADAVVGGACTETELDAALATVQGSGGGRITFVCGAAKTILLSQQKNITTPVTVDGGGKVTLSGVNSVRHFGVFPDTHLTLKDITLSNGFASGADAGSIYNLGTLTLVRVVLRDNVAGANGGAIIALGPVTVTASVFQDNQAVQGGGAIIAYGPVTVTDSVFQDNRATAGGALYPLAEAADLVLVRTTFRRNQATGHGGAIRLGDGADATIRGSRFEENTAYQGGAIQIESLSSSLTVGMTTFLRNAGVGSSGYGGAIFTRGPTVLVSSTFLENVSELAGAILTGENNLVLEDCLLAGNQSRGGLAGGGALYAYSSSVTVRTSTISGNTAPVGGGVFASASQLSITRSTVSGNTTVDRGAAIRSSNTALTLDRTTVAANVGSSDSGLSVAGGSLILASSSVSGGGQGPDCTLSQATVTASFSLDSDGTCGLGAGPGNLPDTPPGLGPLDANGGPTPTHLPLAGSALVDHGQCDPAVPRDQRGASRPAGAACDIGAVERGGAFVEVFRDDFELGSSIRWGEVVPLR